MSKPSSSRIVCRYFHLTAFKQSSDNPLTVQIPTFRTWLISARNHFSSLPNITRTFDRLYPDAKFSPNRDFHGFRCFSLKNEMGSENLAKDAVKNPVVAVKDTFLWYKEAFCKKKLSAVAGSSMICNYWDEEHGMLEDEDDAERELQNTKRSSSIDPPHLSYLILCCSLQ